MRSVIERGFTKRRWGMAVVTGLLLAALAALSWHVRDAGAQEEAACNPTCVILIQVDGLEPKDVTPTTTPYMWAMAHPPTPGVPGSALLSRAGWIWQAPRGVATSGTAPATASLLTGAYPELTGITGDDFIGANSQGDSNARQRLSAGGFGDAFHGAADGPDVAEPISPPAVETVVEVVSELERDAAVFLGDRGLARLTAADRDTTSPKWFPPGDDDSATHVDQQFTGDMRLCPIPRNPDRGTPFANQGPEEGEREEGAGFDPRYCPANDMTTAHKAAADLNHANSKDVAFTFIHLAEYGAAKRLAADPDVDGSQTDPPPQPAQALANADAAIATFIERYAFDDRQAARNKWPHTVVMIVGSHGYQTTPVANRVPDAGKPDDPNAPADDLMDRQPATVADVTRDLSDFVENYDGSLRLVPQGTAATIHYTGAEDKRADTLKAIKDELMTRVQEACELRNPALPPCIKSVHYVDSTLAEDHPTWRLETRHPTTGARTRAGGDLFVVLGRGWAAGRALGTGYQVNEDAGKSNTNPFTASSGGPHERAVAALINGPAESTETGAVRNLDTFAAPQGARYYPASLDPVEPKDHNNPPPVPRRDRQECPDISTDANANDDQKTDFGGLACANHPDKVDDDANDPGHKAQPETVDFAVTISALMKLPFDAHQNQLQGRVLQEAFVNALETPCVSDCEDPPPPQCNDVGAFTVSPDPVTLEFSCADARDAPLTYTIVSPPAHGTLGPVTGATVTYTPHPGFYDNDTFTYMATSKHGPSEVATATVGVIEPPKVVQAPGFTFTGLLQRLKAAVVDSRNQPYKKAKRGSLLSTIRLEADFGKPETAVTLT
ncbi:MAG: alkaline phosphatase family protein, partial [Actinomycetota bacterium]|nr:alkaline phosphatase family protein [Actinomycetota bacterium]